MKKQTLLMLFAFATLIAIGTHFLFKPNKEIPINPSIQDAKMVQATIKTLNTNHAIELKKMKGNHDFLVTQIQQSKKQINVVKKQENYLRNLLKSKMSKQAIITHQDTSHYFQQCDSLQYALTDLIDIGIEKDSFINRQNIQFENLICTLDSTNQCVEMDYNALQKSSDTLFKINEQLSNENKHFAKIIFRNHRTTNIITGAFIVLAGIATASQLKTIN